MYSNGAMEHSLGKIQALIAFLNFGMDERYRFDDLEVRGKRCEKLAGKIGEV